MGRLLTFSFALVFSTIAWSADCGQFRVVKGDVTYKAKDKPDYEKARINKQVCQGDSIKTGKDSRAKVVMADANEINVSPDSEMMLEVYDTAQAGDKKVLLNVIYGKIRSNVKQKYKDDARSHYRVKTKSAVAGVRGTEFLTSFDMRTNETKVVTFEGEVNVGQMVGGNLMAAVSVKAGQYTSNTPATNPHAPKDVPPQELTKMDSESSMGEAPRAVSGNSGADSEDDSDDSKKEEPKKEEIKKEDSKKADPVKDQGSKDSKGASTTKSEGGRQPASVDKPSSDIGLPKAELPKAGLMVTEGPKPPTIPNYNPTLPVVPPLPPIVTDSIINQKVQVIIIPRLPGQ